jgi:hypothetical protein
MRLINCHTLQLHEFFESQVPQYAILSHTWGSEEVSCKEMRKGRGKEKENEGYLKIKYCCAQAVKDGLEWAWVDTCCIEKSSSAELSEAINSMFRWYQNAAICYAYLSDAAEEVDVRVENSAFRNSRWFTRGWTLQELLAPENVWFYSAGWKHIGQKKDLCQTIAEITRIDGTVLKHQKSLSSYSVAQRMSWASRRKTTRVEDLAYCLLGLFDVNLPLIYGEGQKSFLRLQEEIMKGTHDQSLFAWERIDGVGSFPENILASAPICFANAGNIVVYRRRDAVEPHAMTNRGLRITLPIIDPDEDNSNGILHVAILCCHRTTDLGYPLRILLIAHGNTNRFSRLEDFIPILISKDKICDAVEKEIYIGRYEVAYDPAIRLQEKKFILRFGGHFTPVEFFPPSCWEKSHGVLEVPSDGDMRDWHAVFLLRASRYIDEPFSIVLGRGKSFPYPAWCSIGPKSRSKSLHNRSKHSLHDLWQDFQDLGEESSEDLNKEGGKRYSYSNVIQNENSSSAKVTVAIEERMVMGEESFVTEFSIEECEKNLHRVNY